jgi:GTP-binding protein
MTESAPVPFALPMVALVGRPNVGKSTLFNRLLRQRRALVQGRPGVTRDRLIDETEIEGRRLLLVDTGGLEPDAAPGFQADVSLQVRRAIADASLVLFVVDAQAGLLPADARIAEVLRRSGRPVVVVASKADGPRQEREASEFHALGFDPVIPVSAEHRRGLVDLELAIAERLPAGEPAAGPASDAVRVAIVGRPNVGKSSLVNRLCGEPRALVSPEPGTTRDATDARVQVGDREVVLVDTAGLRRPGRRTDSLERGSAYMALRAIERADVVLLLLDAQEGATEQDAKIARLALDRGRPLLLVLNKIDAVDLATRGRELGRNLERRLAFVPERPVLHLSARTGRGCGDLLRSALALEAASRVRVSTAELNRALHEALERNQPPMSGRRRARFYYATQTSERPFTALVFMNDPSLIPENYRRYLESFLSQRFGLRGASARVRLRGRSERAEGRLEGGAEPRER